MENIQTNAAGRTDLSQPTVDVLARQSRLLMVRSNAYDRLANGAEPQEIREVMSPELRSSLLAAIDGWSYEMMVMADLDDKSIKRIVNDEIAGFLRLTGGGWPSEHRQEYLDQCCAEFAEIPVSLLVPAVRQARRTVFEPKRFVSWVFEMVAKDLARLETEGERLKQLGELAGDI